MIKEKHVLCFAALSGAVCVALGAMGAHALKEKIDPISLQTFETAVKYQMYHTFALLLVVPLSNRFHSNLLFKSSYFFMIGILLFSFSLYFLALRPILGIEINEMKWVGAITPFGGLSFIIGWLMIAVAALSCKKQ
jgi:uncharacterized membrane protein YgdD (TMEM256/DUF423 family)